MESSWRLVGWLAATKVNMSVWLGHAEWTSEWAEYTRVSAVSECASDVWVSDRVCGVRQWIWVCEWDCRVCDVSDVSDHDDSTDLWVCEWLHE